MGIKLKVKQNFLIMEVKAMEINKSILIPTKEGKAIMSVTTAYTKKDGFDLIQQYSELVGSDTFGKYFRRISKDNGKTWSEPSLIFEPKKIEEGVWRWGENTFFLDEEKNILLYFYNYHLYPDSHYTGEVAKYTRIFYKTSYDGGKTFSNPIQLIQKGYNEEKWAKDVIFGKNSIQISFCAPIKIDNKIFLPVQKVPLDSDFNRPFSILWEAGCFIGEWKGDKIEWDLGETVKIDPALSSRGLCEPALAKLMNGYILMICRGSNAGLIGVPGYKWYSISKDGGLTWSEPKALKYDDETNFFSPATGSRLIRNSQNKKLYWIGNITRINPDGNRPRYPLQIAEIDEMNVSIKKDTVQVIEDKEKDDSGFVQFSNFKVYEDRKTHEFVLIMARIEEKGKGDLTSPAYEYKINVFK